MKKAILATKVGMTQIFNEDGTLTPVTVLQAGPCVVTQIKTVEKDGYSAVQVGFVDKKDKIVNKDKNGKKEIVHRHGVTKAEQGHFAKAGVSGKRFVREFKFENAEEFTLAQEIKADIFAAELLIPYHLIKDKNVFQVKKHFGVSQSAAEAQLRQAAKVRKRHDKKSHAKEKRPSVESLNR